MPRTMDTIPEALECEVCQTLVESRLFLRNLVSQSRRDRTGCGRYTVSDVCSPCQSKRSKGKLPHEQRERYDAMVARNRRAQADRQKKDGHDMAARNRARAAEVAAQKRETYERKKSEVTPYDQAVAELEQAWGVPVDKWTLKQDAECTLRMYDILGWARASFLRKDMTHA